MEAFQGGQGGAQVGVGHGGDGHNADDDGCAQGGGHLAEGGGKGIAVADQLLGQGV